MVGGDCPFTVMRGKVENVGTDTCVRANVVMQLLKFYVKGSNDGRGVEVIERKTYEILI